MWVIEIDLYNKHLKNHINLCYHKVTNFCVTNSALFIYSEDLHVTYQIEDVTRFEVYKEVK